MAPDLQVRLDLPSLLLSARSIGSPYVEVGVARALNGEARALEMRAQVIEQGAAWIRPTARVFERRDFYLL